MQKHNHFTRDIKRLGKCPACDEYWMRRPVKAIRFKTLDELEAAQEGQVTPGYALIREPDDPENHAILWVVLPTGVGSRLPLGGAGWAFTEHEDDTVTVTPSIWDRSTDNGWHGWLTNGEFISC